MNAQTVRTLGALSATALVVGAMIPAPMARFSVMFVSLILALLVVCFGATKWRIAGVLLVMAALGMALDSYPGATQEERRYVEHARAR